MSDDSSTVFDADTVVPDEVPSLPPASQEESPQSFTSLLLRRINSTRHHPTMPSASTTTATATATATGYDANIVIPYQEESPATAARSEEISRSNHRQSSSSSSSKKRSIITNSSSHQSTKRPRRSSRLKRQPDQSCVDDKSDSEVEDENEHEDFEPDEAVINQSSSSSSRTSTTKLTKRELKWKSKFEKLCDYKRLHGNVNVPKSNRELGIWVSKQRTWYRKFKKNGKSQITPERIELLESIGFEWVCHKNNESKWNKRFNELKDYKEKFGHTIVPQSNKQLGNWVSTQRKEYKKFKKNGKGKITKERIEMLNSIGFDWVSQYKTPRNESLWNKRLNELKAYKDLHGHTDVSTYDEDNKQLGNWVMTQRTEYRKFKENKKTLLTPERTEKLNSIGFQWESHPGRALRS